MYLVGQLHFLILEKGPYVGDILWAPAAQSSMVTRTICSRSAPYVGCVYPSIVVGLTTVGALLDRAGPPLCWLPGLALCSGCWPSDGQGHILAQLAAGLMGAQDWCWPAGGQESPQCQ